MTLRQTSRSSVLIIAVTAACALLSGCGGTDTDKSDSDQPAETAAAAATKSQNLIRNAMARLDPKRLGITSKPNMAAMGMNDWFKRSAKDDWSKDWPDITELLGSEAASRASSQRFTENDARHARTSLLLRSYAKAVPGESETERVVNLFYAIVRDVALETDEPLSLTPFEVLVTGRGTPEDRAWLFAIALRQLRIDSFIVSPKEKDNWLVGVSTGGEVLLFDPALGLPVFQPAANAGDILPQQPATLADLSGEDEILGGMGVEGHEYPLADADLTAPSVLLIGGPSVWAQRNLLLQDALTGDNVVVIADPIQDLEDTPGLKTRVVEAGAGLWSEADVQVWSYPAERINGFALLSESDQSRLNTLLDPLKARVEREIADDDVVFGNPSWELFQARIDQLRGVEGDSVPILFQTVRLGKLQRELTFNTPQGEQTLRIPEEFYTIHYRAAEDAGMWVAVNHYRDQEFAAAVDGFYALRRKFENSVWDRHSRYLLALALAQHGQMDKAVSELTEAAKSGDALAHGEHLILRLWQRSAPGQGNPEPDAATPDASQNADDPEPGQEAA